jgi:hypothetical protein
MIDGLRAAGYELATVAALLSSAGGLDGPASD